MKKLLQIGFFLIFTAHAVSLANAGSQQAASSAGEANTTQPDTPQPPWLGPDFKPLPFTTDEEILEFLKTAKVLSRKGVKVGITGIEQVLLEKDGVQMHAAFRDVKIRKAHVKLGDGTTEFNFRDDCKFEIAAYRLSKLLGLNNVPPVVKRGMFGQDGTLQIWVEKAMMEQDRVKKKITPQGGLKWSNQVQIMRSFDNLIANKDRNQGNFLIDEDWKLWMIDHTRAFGNGKKMLNPYPLRHCNPEFWGKVKSLEMESLKQEMNGVLSKDQIKALLKRRDTLMKKVDKLLEKKTKKKAE